MSESNNITPSDKGISEMKMFIKLTQREPTEESPTKKLQRLHLWENVRETIKESVELSLKWNVVDINKLRFTQPDRLDLFMVEKIPDRVMFERDPVHESGHLIIAGIREGGIEDKELAEPFSELVELLIAHQTKHDWDTIRITQKVGFERVDVERLKRELEGKL